MKKIRILASAVLLAFATMASAQTTSWIEEGVSFTDGTLVYWIKNYPSGYAVASGNQSHLLGSVTYYDGKGELNDGEVAVSLLKNQTLTVTDTISITASNITNYYSSTLGKLTTWYDYQNRNILTFGGTTTTIANSASCENGRTDSIATLDGCIYTYLGVLGTNVRITTFTKYGPYKRDEWIAGANKRITNKESSGARFYKREGIQISGSTAKNVNIPATVTAPDGTSYNVGIVAYAGFVYDKTTFHATPFCQDGYTWGDGCYCVPGGNDYLETVTFDADSKVRLIKDYAFLGCTKLKSVVIPKTVTTIGTSAFCYDRALTTVTFQTADDNTSALRTIAGYVFRGCERIQVLSFPEGLETIGDCAVMWNTSLASVTLPNTLTTVGAHFLCCATQLKRVTIPAALKNIDGALFHGCESLEEVTMLGFADNLKSASGGFTTFDANNQYCADGVDKTNVKLYVPATYVSDYKNDPTWGALANIEETPGAYRDFTGGKWATVAFPKGVTNYKSVFGSESKFATMTSATREAGWQADPQTGKSIVVYTLNFTQSDAADIPEDTPVMFYPQNDLRYAMWLNSDLGDEDFVADMTNTHTLSFKAENAEDPDNSHWDAMIYMNSQYVPYKMQVWDFYVTTNKTTGKQEFRRVPSLDKAATAGATRCYWTVRVSGMPAETALSNVKEDFFYEDVNAITRVVVDDEVVGIFDLQGRRLSAPQKGLNIVNGKKVVIK